MRIEIPARPKKRLFLALILASVLLAILSTLGIWVVSRPGLTSISQHLPLIINLSRYVLT